MGNPMLHFAAMYAAGAMAGMQMRCVEDKDQGASFPGERFARFHDSPKNPTEKKIQPVTESAIERKKRRASLRRRFK